MQGKWILELPGASGLGKHEVSIIKAFVSAQTDKVRLAYAHRAVDYQRQCIFIGSTNDSQYLRDSTGGRRFWPVICEVDEIDTDALEREIDQVWAEARAIYRDMRQGKPRGTLPLYVTDAEAKADAHARQEERRVLGLDEELSGDIANWLDKPVGDPTGFEDDEVSVGEGPKRRDIVCSMEIWCEMLGREKSLYYNQMQQQQQIGRALRQLEGWKQAERIYTEKYGRQRVFRRIGVPII